MSNPIAQFLRIEKLVREIYSFDDATIPIYASNSRGAIFYCDKTTGYKSRPAEENGKKNKENEKFFFFMNNELSILWYYINSRPSVQARRAFCCAFPAFLLPMAQKLSSDFA